MSSLLKTIKKIKKKKKEENIMTPRKHEKIGNLNLFSEEISKNIIEKIISLVITYNFNKKSDKKIGDFCFASMRKTINNIIKLCNINHDKDDFDIDNIEINTYIKTNKSDNDMKRYLIKKHNDAKETRNDKAEINIPQIARIAKDFKAYHSLKNIKKEECFNKSTIIEKNKYLKLDKIIQYDIEIEKNNFWGDIPCPQISDIDRTSSKFNSYIPIKEKSKKKSPNNSPKKLQKEKKDNKLNKKSEFNYKAFVSRLTKQLSSSKLNKENNNENIINKSPSRVQMIDLPSYPISIIEPRKESEEIINLRKEQMDLIIQKEKENKKKRELDEMQRRKEEEEMFKKKIKGNYTFDNEGKLISVYEIRQDKLLKEFLPINYKQKEIKKGMTLDVYRKQTIEMENNAEKNIVYNDEEYNLYNSFLSKSRLTVPFINFNEFKKNIYSNNNHLKFKRNKNNSFFSLFNSKQKVEPSGSNFELINPSVGVKVTERKSVKDGGSNYFKEFKKYSIEEFNKTLQDTFELSRYKPKYNNQTPNNELNRLKKSIFSKHFNDNDISNNELNSLNSIIKLDNNYQGTNRNIKIKKHKNMFGKTFSDRFNYNQENKKPHLVKSTSEIILTAKNFIKLKELLFQDDKDKNTYIKLPYHIQTNKNNKIFNKNMLNKTVWRDNSLDKFKTIFSDIDKMNKNIIMGKEIDEKKYFNNKMILPKLSLRNNETNFNRTMMNFSRERIKKSMWENVSQKIEKIQKLKNIRKINSVKNK